MSAHSHRLAVLPDALQPTHHQASSAGHSLVKKLLSGTLHPWLFCHFLWWNLCETLNQISVNFIRFKSCKVYFPTTVGSNWKSPAEERLGYPKWKLNISLLNKRWGQSFQYNDSSNIYLYENVSFLVASHHGDDIFWLCLIGERICKHFVSILWLHFSILHHVLWSVKDFKYDEFNLSNYSLMDHVWWWWISEHFCPSNCHEDFLTFCSWRSFIVLSLLFRPIFGFMFF